MYGNERTVMATATYNWWRPSGGIENARAGSASGIYTCQTAPADATRHRPGRSAPRVGTSIAQAQQACAREIYMTRKYIDCREYPSEMNCSVALAADSESELLEAAVQHATTVHKHADTPELRAQLKSLFHDGTPPVETPRHA